MRFNELIILFITGGVCFALGLGAGTRGRPDVEPPPRVELRDDHELEVWSRALEGSLAGRCSRVAGGTVAHCTCAAEYGDNAVREYRARSAP